MKATKPRRTRSSIMFTPSEMARIKARAADARLTVPAFIVACTLEDNRASTDTELTWTESRRLVGRLSRLAAATRTLLEPLDSGVTVRELSVFLYRARMEELRRHDIGEPPVV